MIFRKFFLVSSLCVMFCACFERNSGKADPTDLMNADRAFAKATSERGVDGWVEFFADNGAMLPAGLPLIRGKDAIRELMTPTFADESASLVWEPTEADIAASGDLGYTIGRYERTTAAPDGTKTTTVGKYVSIWKKQVDGTWKVVVDLGTPNEQPGEN